MSRPRGNTLLEKEKHRNLEKQREELVNFQRLRNQHRQEQVQWEQERERQRVQAEIREKELSERELECSKLEEKLVEDKQELARGRMVYQEDLERLRDTMRAVEKEKEQLQKKYKKYENVPNTFPLENEQIQVRAILYCIKKKNVTEKLHISEHNNKYNNACISDQAVFLANTILEVYEYMCHC